MAEVSKEEFLRRAGFSPSCPGCRSLLIEICVECGRPMEVELHADGRIRWFCFFCREVLEDRFPFD